MGLSCEAADLRTVLVIFNLLPAVCVRAEPCVQLYWCTQDCGLVLGDSHFIQPLSPAAVFVSSVWGAAVCAAVL